MLDKSTWTRVRPSRRIVRMVTLEFPRHAILVKEHPLLVAKTAVALRVGRGRPVNGHRRPHQHQRHAPNTQPHCFRGSRILLLILSAQPGRRQRPAAGGAIGVQHEEGGSAPAHGLALPRRGVSGGRRRRRGGRRLALGAAADLVLEVLGVLALLDLDGDDQREVVEFQ